MGPLVLYCKSPTRVANLVTIDNRYTVESFSKAERGHVEGSHRVNLSDIVRGEEGRGA